jgi:hypothetical protein
MLRGAGSHRELGGGEVTGAALGGVGGHLRILMGGQHCLVSDRFIIRNAQYMIGLLSDRIGAVGYLINLVSERFDIKWVCYQIGSVSDGMGPR